MASIAELLAGMPADLTPAERLASRNILTTALARVARITSLDQAPAVLSIFFEWASCDVMSPTWHADLRTFVVRCAKTLTSKTVFTSSCLGDPRIVRAVQMIDARYADPRLSMSAVAAHAGLSTGHFARLLKRSTGLGFSAVLHRARIAAAETLVDERRLSVKQIAVAVGYRQSSQFCRHFKRLTGTTPSHRRDMAARRIV